MNRTRPLHLKLLLLLALQIVCLATPLEAAPSGYTIFDTLTPPYSPQGGATINANPVYGGYAMSATHFTPSASGFLTSIELQIIRLGEWPTARLDLSLTLEGQSSTPFGRTLLSTTFTVTNNFSDPRVTTLQFSNQVWLSDTTPYWVVIAPHDNTAFAAWTFSSQPGLVGWASVANPAPQDWHLVETHMPQFRLLAVP